MIWVNFQNKQIRVQNIHFHNRWGRNWSMKGKYSKINFQKVSKALSSLYIITFLWSSAANFQMKKKPPTSHHYFCNSNSGLSKVQNKMRKEYFRIAGGWIIWILIFFSIYGIHQWHTDSKMAAMQMSKSTSFLHICSFRRYMDWETSSF